jgi:hypothetical protein
MLRFSSSTTLGLPLTMFRLAGITATKAKLANRVVAKIWENFAFPIATGVTLDFSQQQ